MGGSLLEGWRESRRGRRGAIVVDPALPALSGGESRSVASLAELPDPLPETILLAVKPQMMDAVLPALAPRLPQGALVISIAAGKTIAYLRGHAGVPRSASSAPCPTRRPRSAAASPCAAPARRRRCAARDGRPADGAPSAKSPGSRTKT